MLELFKPIKGYEGLYLISNLGTVKSCDRYIIRNNYRTLLKGKIMKDRVRKNGCSSEMYHIIDLYDKDGNKKTWRLHRLVAINFVKNPNPELYDIVNHIDGNKNNNAAYNLEWVNNAMNVKHAHDNKLNIISEEKKIKLSKQVKGIAPKDRKKEVIKLDKEGNILDIYESLTQASKENKIDRATIRDAITGRRGAKTAKGFYWKFK